MNIKEEGEKLIDKASDATDKLQAKWDAASEKKRKKIRIGLAVIAVVLIVLLAKCAGQ